MTLDVLLNLSFFYRLWMLGKNKNGSVVKALVILKTEELENSFPQADKN